MRENIKNIGLILAIIIAGVSLPTSIMSFTNKPTTPITEVNNYFYNNTVIERYNNTIIVWINNTIIVNNTENQIEYPFVAENISCSSTGVKSVYFYNASSNNLIWFLRNIDTGGIQIEILPRSLYEIDPDAPFSADEAITTSQIRTITFPYETEWAIRLRVYSTGGITEVYHQVVYI